MPKGKTAPAEATKKVKYGRLVFKSTPLHGVLKKLREHYKNAGEPEELAVPYVLTCAAYLEAKLNDSLLMTGRKEYGEEVADALMSLALPTKLKVLVPVLTKGQYRINMEHFVYRRLASLIVVRNSVAHAKTKLEVTHVDPTDLVQFPLITSGSTPMPKQFLDDLGKSDDALGVTKTFTPLEYHEALDKLEKWFFHRCPAQLAKVDIVVNRSSEEDWKEAGTFLRLDLRD